MRIDGTLPPHIAQAYGIRPMKPAMPVQAAGAMAPTQQVGGVSATGNVKAAGVIGKLVAAVVPQSIAFDGASATMPRPAGTLQLYTRAADKVEVSVAVQLGRSLDVKG